MLIDFCLPVKNEEAILKTNSLKLYDYLKSQNMAYAWRIIIIVNGSADNSFKIASDLEKKYTKYFKAKNIKAGGKGLALKTYFRESQADILSFMDIDLAVALENISNLIKPLLNNEADMVIGSRHLAGSKTTRSKFTNFRSSQYNKISQYLLGHKLSDLQCGFKAFKKELFVTLDPLLKDNKWFFDTEFVILAKHFNYKIKEIPVDWQENRFQKRKSKVKNIEAYRFFKKLFEFRKYLKTVEKRFNTQK
jgi:glycosyltransferase involved in cell wall biosynthesis